jgi:hypothetical protein
MRKFKANMYMAKKTNEVCPSKWKDEGDVTLSPSASMVGRVHEALGKSGNPHRFFEFLSLRVQFLLRSPKDSKKRAINCATKTRALAHISLRGCS